MRISEFLNDEPKEATLDEVLEWMEGGGVTPIPLMSRQTLMTVAYKARAGSYALKKYPYIMEDFFCW